MIVHTTPPPPGVVGMTSSGATFTILAIVTRYDDDGAPLAVHAVDAFGIERKLGPDDEDYQALGDDAPSALVRELDESDIVSALLARDLRRLGAINLDDYVRRWRSIEQLRNEAERLIHEGVAVGWIERNLLEAAQPPEEREWFL